MEVSASFFLWLLEAPAPGPEAASPHSVHLTLVVTSPSCPQITVCLISIISLRLDPQLDALYKFREQDMRSRLSSVTSSLVLLQRNSCWRTHGSHSPPPSSRQASGTWCWLCGGEMTVRPSSPRVVVSRVAAQGHCVRTGWAHTVSDFHSGNWKEEQDFSFVLARGTLACQCKTPEPLVSLCKVKMVGNWRIV